MCQLGIGELIVLGFVIVVVFSASRMGALGNALGKFVYSFRKAAKGQDFIDVKPRRIDPTETHSALPLGEAPPSNGGEDPRG